ncbi:MAG: ATP-binding protein, partial [Spirochaetales bacterium]|nr:ATP-binding protein [Spirochaetales bacterium]
MRKRDFKNLTIGSQLILAFLLAITLSVLIVTIVFTRNSFQTVRRESLQNFSLNNNQITTNLNETLDTIDNYYNFVLSNRVIYNGLQHESFGISSDTYEAVILFKDLLFSFISITDGMESAFYISREGTVISYLSGMVNPEFVNSGHFLELPFIDELKEDPRREIWYLPQQEGAQHSIFYVRSIVDPRDREILGFLSFIINKDIIASQIKRLAEGKTDFFVCDDQGQLIVSTVIGETTFPAELMDRIEENPLRTVWRHKERYYFVEQTYNSWYVISQLAVSDLIDMKKIALLGILTFFLSLIPGFFISVFFSRRYSRDFQYLIDTMKKSQQGQIVRIANQGSNVEARTMASQYNDMMENIAGLTSSLRQEIADKNKAEQERKKLESQLRQSQKMEAVGQLAGGVAHDFNNLLTALFGYVDIGKITAEQELGSDHELHYHLTEIEKLAQRAASLTKQLLTFSRKDVVKLKKLNLNNVIEDMADMLMRLVKENIKLNIFPKEGLYPIKADTGHMEQVLVNLIVNAVHAMPNGGTVIIETSRINLSEEYIQQHTGSSSGPHILLSVSDTGHGMSNETMEKIFEPFFTTKFMDKGTGLGLATVHGIVTQLGGHISVYSEINLGTTFRLYFPALKGATEIQEEKKEKEPKRENVRGGSETILFCEDNTSVRELVHTTLETAGYHMLTYEDGALALGGA